MPKLYLNPPTQPGGEYPNGGDEQYWINKIADAMEERLAGSGVETVRSHAGMGEGGAVKAANRENCGLYLALGSHAAPEESAGQLKGLDVYYYEFSAAGKQAAEAFAARLKEIYPEPGLAGARPSAELMELRETKAPALLIRLAYHDNPQDEAWLVNSVEDIAQTLAQAAAEVLEVPLGDA